MVDAINRYHNYTESTRLYHRYFGPVSEIRYLDFPGWSHPVPEIGILIRPVQEIRHACTCVSGLS